MYALYHQHYLNKFKANRSRMVREMTNSIKQTNMKPLLQKFSILFFLVAVKGLAPLNAQQTSSDQSFEPFIKQGTLLTSFSLGFTHASPTDDNDNIVNEFNLLSIKIEGLYFLSDQIGIGPIIGYSYYYFEGPNRLFGGIIERRRWQFEFGVKGGWYIPVQQVLEGLGRTQFFVDAGISWHQDRIKEVGAFEIDTGYLFGFQVGTGFLFPVGNQIAIETKLGFQARHKKIYSEQRLPNGNSKIFAANKWLEEISLRLGLIVTF